MLALFASQLWVWCLSIQTTRHHRSSPSSLTFHRRYLHIRRRRRRHHLTTSDRSWWTLLYDVDINIIIMMIVDVINITQRQWRWWWWCWWYKNRRRHSHRHVAHERLVILRVIGKGNKKSQVSSRYLLKGQPLRRAKKMFERLLTSIQFSFNNISNAHMLVEDEAVENNTRRRTSLIRPQLLLVRAAKGCHQLTEWFGLEKSFSSWSAVPTVMFKDYDWYGEKRVVLR